jgi:hypothetical protein
LEVLLGLARRVGRQILADTLLSLAEAVVVVVVIHPASGLRLSTAAVAAGAAVLAQHQMAVLVGLLAMFTQPVAVGLAVTPALGLLVLLPQ